MSVSYSMVMGGGVSGAIPPLPIYAFLECIGNVHEQLYFFPLTEMCVDKLGTFQTF